MSKTRIDLLAVAELNYKFAIGISAAIVSSPTTISESLGSFSWGSYRLEASELELSKADELRGASIAEHVATFALMLQLDRVLQDGVPNRFSAADDMLRGASRIANLIRNAFAHDPFNPVWLIDRKLVGQVFDFSGLIVLDTGRLRGHPVRRRDFGGPIALLRMTQYCRAVLACEQTDDPPRPAATA
jgi:hypothetical protein